MSFLLSVAAGTLVTVTASFTNETGVPTDPSTISLNFSQGQVGFTVYEWEYEGAGSITRTSTGIYVAELDTTGLPGSWIGEWIGTGACQVAQPFGFTVTPLPF